MVLMEHTAPRHVSLASKAPVKNGLMKNQNKTVASILLAMGWDRDSHNIKSNQNMFNEEFSKSGSVES